MFNRQASSCEKSFMTNDGVLVNNVFNFENNWSVSCIHYEGYGDESKWYPLPKRFEVMVLYNKIPKRVFKETKSSNVIHVDTVNGINNILEQMDKISKWNHSKETKI